MLTFSESGLKPEILKAVKELNFVTPTPIQQKTIPTLLDSASDLIGLAQTGTGKRLLSACH
jgi:ATP-dependent RNA helicase DeaD